MSAHPPLARSANGSACGRLGGLLGPWRGVRRVSSSRERLCGGRLGAVPGVGGGASREDAGVRSGSCAGSAAYWALVGARVVGAGTDREAGACRAGPDAGAGAGADVGGGARACGRPTRRGCGGARAWGLDVVGCSSCTGVRARCGNNGGARVPPGDDGGAPASPLPPLDSRTSISLGSMFTSRRVPSRPPPDAWRSLAVHARAVRRARDGECDSIRIAPRFGSDKRSHHDDEKFVALPRCRRKPNLCIQFRSSEPNLHS
jgi:hypothetical protein